MHQQVKLRSLQSQARQKGKENIQTIHLTEQFQKQINCDVFNIRSPRQKSPSYQQSQQKSKFQLWTQAQKNCYNQPDIRSKYFQQKNLDQLSPSGSRVLGNQTPNQENIPQENWKGSIKKMQLRRKQRNIELNERVCLSAEWHFPTTNMSLIIPQSFKLRSNNYVLSPLNIMKLNSVPYGPIYVKNLLRRPRTNKPKINIVTPRINQKMLQLIDWNRQNPISNGNEFS